jgi:hypothetical protein
VAANIIGFAAIMKAHAELAMRTSADAQFAVMEADFSVNVCVRQPFIRAVVTAIQSTAPAFTGT